MATKKTQKNKKKTTFLCSGKQERNQFSALHTWGRCWVNILCVSMAAECCEQRGNEATTPAALNVALCCVSRYSYKTHQILNSSQKHICTSGGAGQMFLGWQLTAAVDCNNPAVRHQSQAVLLGLSHWYYIILFYGQTGRVRGKPPPQTGHNNRNLLFAWMNYSNYSSSSAFIYMQRTKKKKHPPMSIFTESIS